MDGLETKARMKEYTLKRLSVNGSIPIIQINGHTEGAQVNGNVSHEYSNYPPIPLMKEDSPPPLPANPPRMTETQKSRPSSGRTKQKFIPEHDIEIPPNGSLHDFSADDLATFFRHMGIEDRIVNHVQKKGLDGARFSRLNDSDLERLEMKNPIICHFRDKSISTKSPKKKSGFMML